MYIYIYIYIYNIGVKISANINLRHPSVAFVADNHPKYLREDVDSTFEKKKPNASDNRQRQ